MNKYLIRVPLSRHIKLRLGSESSYLYSIAYINYLVRAKEKIEEILKEYNEKHSVDFRGISDRELLSLESFLHYETIKELKLAYSELDLVLNLAIVAFFMPISIFCKFVFSKIAEKTFNITVSNVLDATITGLVVAVWTVTLGY